jgi:hypothetical protein
MVGVRWATFDTDATNATVQAYDDRIPPYSEHSGTVFSLRKAQTLGVQSILNVFSILFADAVVVAFFLGRRLLFKKKLYTIISI